MTPPASRSLIPEAPASGWSEWQRLPSAETFSPRVLAEILDGGQAFRWQRTSDVTWLGQFGDGVVRIALTAEGQLAWSSPSSLTAHVGPALVAYLDLARDSRTLADTLPWRSDAHLARCLETFPGLRILRQPFGETLLGFLCSATKQIVQIKQMVALLADRHGAPVLPTTADRSSLANRAAALGDPSTLNPQPSTPFHRLPTWPELAAVSEAELRACLLGFRARYIHQTAQFLAAHPGWLAETEALPYAAAKDRLCSLPGVGEKVADCVLLFGAGRLEAFPVDVWIIKTMAARYGLQGWKPAQIAQFGRVHFGPLAGLAQQYLFAYERAAARPPV
ncbi:DNA-3-methyladenine glycosylase family protein [Opitutus terrae]|uniref:DNA-(apurinic or apyrimidinic site) lyase n=1 Tax=Opitutus terrae (strain DSM 11246 / JCM 15787 / PB90-1) TaxID=452637 RepID=B1ZYM7_OPITP|nr:DNA glycosylase [Opitutus terrae]ACB75263.1 helix-hairpin-helix motif [Opitutus terrae PB90-1]